VKADILILGKAISGGLPSFSCIRNEIMNVIQAAWFFGGIQAAVAVAALEVVREENLSVNAERLGIKKRIE
jgi:ornithine--oxo-acid transaminase